MKIKFHHIAMFILMLSAAGCKLDNVKPPSIKLTGQLMYKGSPIGVEYNQVPFQLYQTGYKGNTPITGTFDQDGAYSVLTFSGNYKFTIQPGQGPFQWKELPSGGRDTINIALTGDQTVNIEVTPYYMVRNAQIVAANGKINANFSIEKIITDATAKNIQTVSLFVNKTQFVSPSDNAAKVDLDGGAITDLSNLSLSVNIPSFPVTQNYVYARVGIRIAGVEDMIFSPVVKVSY
ncbi:DUF3823 domain-containing protein [Mucilaginibacter sp. SG564]|uniref:DUF3823 domain-containing protein n=1 Tax=Mucilaginibacter sp. SG564 TaxID=2587022 RepID=UPI001553FB7F|nr:DUF3823 domain-containing protein [Mucilaginibacter sp. SG564]NOW94253.1 hypothetical protein [Mucilaginibacter sp. SG564]